MTEVSAVRINANGTYSDYFQISDGGAIIFQGSPNPNTITTNPAPSPGDLFLCTSIPEVFIYNGTAWVAIGESSSGFYSQNITQSGVTIGNGVSYIGSLYASVNIASSSVLTLPTPVQTGTTIIVKDESGLAGTNTITLSSENNSTIDGQASVIIDVNYGTYTFLYNGSNWTIIAAISSFPLNQLLLGGGDVSGYTLPAISPYLSYVNNFEIQQFIPGNITTSQVLSAVSIVDNITFPQNFVGSIANCLTLPQNNVIININIGSTYVGTLNFLANSSTGYFTSSGQINVNPGSVLIFTVSSSDTSISGISFTLSATSLYNQIVLNPYIKITNALVSSYSAGTPFAVSGNVYPRNSVVNVGYTASSTIPPSTTTPVTSDSYGNWTTNVTISTVGSYYVWAQINGTSDYTNLAVVID